MKSKKLKLTFANMAAITLIVTQASSLFESTDKYNFSNRVAMASESVDPSADTNDKPAEEIIAETKPKLESEKAKLAEIKQKKAEVEKKLEEPLRKINEAEGKKTDARNEYKKYSDALKAAEDKQKEAQKALEAAGDDSEKRKAAEKMRNEALVEANAASNNWNTLGLAAEKKFSETEREVQPIIIENEQIAAPLKAELKKLEEAETVARNNITHYEEEIANAEREIADSELEKHRNDVREAIGNLEDGKNYPGLIEIKEKALSANEKATTIEEMDNILKKAKEDIDALKEALGNPESEEDLKKAKDAAYDALIALAEGVENPEALKAINKATDQVEAAGTTSAVSEVVKEAEAEVARIKEEDKAKADVDKKEKEDAKALLNKVKAEAKEILKKEGVSEFYLKRIDSAKTVEGVEALKDLILKVRLKSVPKTAPTLEEKPKADLDIIRNKPELPSNPIVEQPRPDKKEKVIEKVNVKDNKKINEKVNENKSDNKTTKLPNTGQTTSSYIGLVTMALALAFVSRKKYLKNNK